MGLRVSEEEEIVGLDSQRTRSCRPPMQGSALWILQKAQWENENTDLGSANMKKLPKHRKRVCSCRRPVDMDSGMHKVVIIAKLSRYDRLKNALNDLGVTGMTVTQVMGCGIQKGAGRNTVELRWM